MEEVGYDELDLPAFQVRTRRPCSIGNWLARAVLPLRCYRCGASARKCPAAAAAAADAAAAAAAAPTATSPLALLLLPPPPRRHHPDGTTTGVVVVASAGIGG